MKEIFKNNKKKWIITGITLIILALLLTLIRSWLSKPETYTFITKILDEKKSNVTKLLAASTSASALITLIPGDAGTPIATKLADLSTVFLAILAVLYLEKYLLTIIGTVSCFIAAIGILFILVAVWMNIKEKKDKLLLNGIKIITVAIVSLSIIPISVCITNAIDNTYNASIQQSIDQAIDSSDEETASSTKDTEEKSVWEQIASGFSNVVSSVTNSVSEGYEWAQNALNNFIEATAIMLVTSCLIPLLTLVVVVWLAKMFIESLTKQKLELKLPEPKQIEHKEKLID